MNDMSFDDWWALLLAKARRLGVLDAIDQDAKDSYYEYYEDGDAVEDVIDEAASR